MRLIHQHKTPGPGLVIVKAPKDIPIFVTIDGDFLHRSVDVIIDNDRNLAAWAGPSGAGGRIFSVEVGKPSAISAIKDFFGFRGGASISGDEVIASGSGSIAAGGDVNGMALGRGSVVARNGSIAAGGNVSNVTTRRGRVVASGERSIAVGGSVQYVNTGDGGPVEVTPTKDGKTPTEPGIHLFLPFGCPFDKKNDNRVSVSVGDQVVTLNKAYLDGHLELS